MRFALLTKRRYTNRDLMSERFGRLYHLPVQLGVLGYEGVVVAADLHARRTESLAEPNVTFHSLPFSPFALPSFMTAALRIVRSHEPDIVIASGDSYLGYFGSLIAKMLDRPFAFDVYDDYTAFKTNRMPGMKALFHRSVRTADLLIVSSEPLHGKLRGSAEHAVVIPNGYDPRLFRRIPRAEARAEVGIPPTDTVIGYFGTISEQLGIGVLLEATRILAEEEGSLRLLLAGHKADGLDIDHEFVDYRGNRSQVEVPMLINSCDIAIIPYLPSRQVQQSNACKIAEYIACGVPIVATAVSDHARIFTDVPQSLCEPGDARSMAAAMRSQLRSPRRVEPRQDLTWSRLASNLSSAIDITVRDRKRLVS